MDKVMAMFDAYLQDKYNKKLHLLTLTEARAHKDYVSVAQNPYMMITDGVVTINSRLTYDRFFSLGKSCLTNMKKTKSMDFTGLFKSLDDEAQIEDLLNSFK